MHRSRVMSKDRREFHVFLSRPWRRASIKHTPSDRRVSSDKKFQAAILVVVRQTRLIVEPISNRLDAWCRGLQVGLSVADPHGYILQTSAVAFQKEPMLPTRSLQRSLA